MLCETGKCDGVHDVSRVSLVLPIRRAPFTSPRVDVVVVEGAPTDKVRGRVEQVPNVVFCFAVSKNTFVDV